MWQYKCSQCNNIVERKDIRLIKIEDESGKPMIKPVDSCVYCVERLKEKLGDTVTPVNQ